MGDQYCYDGQFSSLESAVYEVRDEIRNLCQILSPSSQEKDECLIECYRGFFVAKELYDRFSKEKVHKAIDNLIEHLEKKPIDKR